MSRSSHNAMRKLLSEMMTAEISSILEPLKSGQYEVQEVEKIFQAAYDYIVSITRYFTPNPYSLSNAQYLIGERMAHQLRLKDISVFHFKVDKSTSEMLLMDPGSYLDDI